MDTGKGAMNIVYLSNGYTPVLPSSARSVETSIYLLAKEQAKLGHKVVIIDTKTTESRGSTHASFYELWTPAISGSTFVGYLLKVVLFALRVPIALLNNRDADIVQAYGQLPVLAAAIARKMLRMKMSLVYLTCSPYLTMPPSIMHKLKHTLLEKWALRSADKVLAHTNTVAKALSNRFGISIDKIAIIPAGINLRGTKHKEGKQYDNNLIFYSAVITPRKNQMILVKTLPNVLKVYPDCKIVLAGPIEDREYHRKIQRYITEHNIKCVKFAGLISKASVYSYYKKAKLMVFPTLSEMQGIILVEAMSMGVPVIASDIDVIRDIADMEKGSALLVNAKSVQDMENAILTVLGDKVLQQSLSEHGRQLAHSRFSWVTIAKEMEREYDKLLQN